MQRLGASQLVGMFKNPEPPGSKEKEVREAEEKEAQARHFSGMVWSVIGAPPPDFTVVSDSTLILLRLRYDKTLKAFNLSR